MTGSTAPELNQFEEWPFVPIGLSAVETGKRIEPWGFRKAASHKSVGHADDGGGIHSAAKLREHGSSGTKPSSHGLAENRPKVLFVFAIVAVGDSFSGIKIPVLLHRCAAIAE